MGVHVDQAGDDNHSPEIQHRQTDGPIAVAGPSDQRMFLSDSDDFAVFDQKISNRIHPAGWIHDPAALAQEIHTPCPLSARIYTIFSGSVKVQDGIENSF